MSRGRDRAWIERHIPHQGDMCLLDTVIAWDEHRIRCSSTSHRAIDNPLRAHGRLGIACGIEYASQAMAVHGALTRGATLGGIAPPGDQPTQGLLAGIRAVEFHALRLDDVLGELLCEAVRLAGDHRTALYEFELHAAAGRLLRGRATVLLDPRDETA
jgi:predicted hotdog family 3-hydroxylacyl-ACP dehydratase